MEKMKRDIEKRERDYDNVC